MLIAASALIALSVLGYLGYRLLMRRLTSRYYRESYAPIELVTSDVAILPDEHHLSDVPWISADVQACQSLSLQMIAAQREIGHIFEARSR